MGRRRRLDIFGVSEVSWSKLGRYVATTREAMIYSDREDGQHKQGVG